MYCQKCGVKNHDSAEFCFHCGEAFADLKTNQETSNHSDFHVTLPDAEYSQYLCSDSVPSSKKVSAIVVNYKKIIILAAIAVAGFILVIIGISQIISSIDVNNVKALAGKKDWQAVEKYVLDSKNMGKRAQTTGLVALINDVDSWSHLINIMLTDKTLLSETPKLNLKLGELLQENGMSERFERYVGDYVYTSMLNNKISDVTRFIHAFRRMNPKDEKIKKLAELNSSVIISETILEGAIETKEKLESTTIRARIDSRSNDDNKTKGYVITFENGDVAVLASSKIDNSWYGQWITIPAIKTAETTGISSPSIKLRLVPVYDAISYENACDTVYEYGEKSNSNKQALYDEVRNWCSRIKVNT